MKPEPYEGWDKFIFHIYQGFFILFSVALWMNFQPQIVVVNWHNIHHNVYVSNTAISDKSQVLVSSIWPQSSIVDFDTLVGCKKWPWFSPSLKRCWVQKKIYFMASKPPEFMAPCHWAITICPFRLVSFILMSWGHLCTMGQSTGG